MNDIYKNYYALDLNVSELQWIIFDAPSIFSDPIDAQARARARLYFDLIEKYFYPPSRIEFDVISPEKKIIDVIAYEDSSHSKPYMIAKCREDWISDDAFKESCFEALELAKSVKAEYCICSAGSRIRILRAETGEIMNNMPLWKG